LVDVPRDRAALRPLEVRLGDLAVLEHRDALLADVDRDQQLALRGRQRRAARRRAAPRRALLALRRTAIGPRLVLLLRGSGLRLGLGLTLGRGVRAGAGALAAAPSAVAAAALLLRRIGRARLGRVGGYGVGSWRSGPRVNR